MASGAQNIVLHVKGAAVTFWCEHFNERPWTASLHFLLSYGAELNNK